MKLLERLCNAVAVSGDEGEVRKIVLEEIRPYADSVRVDAIGNVLARRGTGAGNLRVMLDAHMDEVGFFLVFEEGDGQYGFETVGGVDPNYLLGRSVLVGKSHVPGVIGGKPVHLMDDDEEVLQSISPESLRIDLGPGGKAQVGEWAGFGTQFQRVGQSIFSKAIDDRIGVATVIELFKHAPAHLEICAAFTVQEEIGLRGAQVAAQHFQPDVAIAIDSTPSYDLPAFDGSENVAYNTQLGLGPAIYLIDRRTVHHPQLVRLLAETAQTENIPFQFRQPGGGSTDAGAIQSALGGIPTVSVSVPHRYPHAPVSVARIDDWKHTLRLLQRALERLTSELIE